MLDTISNSFPVSLVNLFNPIVTLDFAIKMNDQVARLENYHKLFKNVYNNLSFPGIYRD